MLDSTAKILPGTGRDGQVAQSPGLGFGSRGDPNLHIIRRMVEGGLSLAPNPLHPAASRRGPPPRAGEELV